MATKLEEKKAEIGYTKVTPSCGNCVRLTSEKSLMHGWEREINIRCGLHKFATKKMAYCNDFVRKVAK